MRKNTIHYQTFKKIIYYQYDPINDYNYLYSYFLAFQEFHLFQRLDLY